MEGATAAKMKDVFQLVRGLGQGQYADLVYARDYGRAEKNIIYKIDFKRHLVRAVPLPRGQRCLAADPHKPEDRER